MDPVLGSQAQLLQARTQRKSQLLELDEAGVLVRTELVVLPLLVHLLLLAVNHLLDLLRLLVQVDDFAMADSLGVAIFAG